MSMLFRNFQEQRLWDIRYAEFYNPIDGEHNFPSHVHYKIVPVPNIGRIETLRMVRCEILLNILP